MNKQNKPLISVIVPVYNTEKLLSRCIDSILEQSYKNLDIILVNDGSTDSSGEICDAFSEKDSRIRVIHKQNEGPSIARNTAMKHIKGEYVLFVDSDDFLGIHHVNNLYDAFRCYSNTSGVVITGLTEVSLTTKRDSSQFCKKGKTQKLTKKDSLVELVSPSGRFASFACGKLYSQDLFKYLDYPAGKYYEDQFVNYKILLNAENIFFEDANDYFYTTDRSQSTSNASKVKRLDYLEAIRIMKNDSELQDEEVKEAVCLRYLFTLADAAMITAKYSEDSKFKKIYEELISQRRRKEISRLPIKARFVFFLSYFGSPVFRTAAQVLYR